MTFPKSFTPRRAFDEEQYHRTLNAGIAAVKGGDVTQARLLLNKAAEMKPTDPLPWLWLSATTQEPNEQKEYLEYALAADPYNSAARRGLVILSEKIDREKLLSEGEQVQNRQPPEPLEAQAEQVFRCEQCGGRMRYDVQQQWLICENCGSRQELSLASVADEAEQPLDFVLPTLHGHRWAEAQHRLTCSQCSAVTIMAVGERTVTCAHCGSSQLIESEESEELIQPNAIAPPKISPAQASEFVRQWLGKGLFIPDDLKELAKPAALRAVYYPFWTFDGILKINWSCEVQRGSGRNATWVIERGEEFEIFDDEWVIGLASLSREVIEQLSPLDFKTVVAYDSAFLTDWSVLAYDRSLAEASLDARQQIALRLRENLYDKVLPGREKRHFQAGATHWVAMTYKLILFPFYVGHYTYRGKDYHLFVNAQNGKVSGAKPLDRVKQAAFVSLVVLSALVLLVALIALGLNLGWFGD